MRLDDFKEKHIIKGNSDSVIWEAYYLGEKYILKEVLTEERLNTMLEECTIAYLLEQRHSDIKYPQIHHIEGTKWFYYLKIPGKRYLSNALKKDEKQVVAIKLIKALDDIHSVPIDGFGDSTINWKNNCINHVQEAFGRIRSLGMYDHQTSKDLCEWFLNGINKYCDEVKKVLIHNDINKENLIVHVENENIQVGIIDFEKFTVGDPLKDISKLIWIFRKDPEFGNIFWEMYCQNSADNNIEILKLYWGFDILNHLMQWNELVKLPNWEAYLNEEKIILREIRMIKKLW